jgi:hypothetical protein
LSKREITDGGLISAFFFGFIGTIAWIVIDISRRQVAQRKEDINALIGDQNLGSTKSNSNFSLVALFLLCIVLYRSHFLIEEGVVFSVSTILFLVSLVSCLLFVYLWISGR